MWIPAKWLTAMGAAMLFAGSTAAEEPAAPRPEPTKIGDWEAFDRIVNNKGMTVQWIDFDGAPRGKADASFQNLILSLKGEQQAPDGVGRVSLSGTIARVDASEFIFKGQIIIEDTPDVGRRCDQTGEWRFAITQNRKYWRLRQFEWCDGLTDYIDIYF
jgi:hypothetical protein